MTGRHAGSGRRNAVRDRRLIAMFASLLVLTAGSVGMHLASADPPPVQAVEREASLGLDQRLTIQFVGDTLLGEAAADPLVHNGYDWPFADVSSVLDGDHVVANVEGPMSVITQPYDPGKKDSYSMNPVAASALVRAGVDSVALANDHAMDAGPAALSQTLDNSAAAGLAAVGAGENLARGEQPLLVRSEIGVVGVVAFNEAANRAARAAVDRPGSVVLSPHTIQRGVDLARAAGADHVIAFVNWGTPYRQIDDQQRYWALMLANAGYDMVVGTGPHIIQPIEFVRSVPIVYSLGNFVYGAPGRFQHYGVPGYGLIVGAELGKTGGARLSVRCVVTDNEVVRFQPRRCIPEQAAALLPSYSHKIVMQGDTGTLACSCFARKGKG